MTDRIDLTGIEVYAKHGVLQEEQEKAQVFRVDVPYIGYNITEPGRKRLRGKSETLRPIIQIAGDPV